MKVLLIGPSPPPHGGISVHVAAIHRQMVAAHIPCKVLDPTGFRRPLRFAWNLVRLGLNGWTFWVHTNGHNWKSWAVALGSGLVGRLSGGAQLTLHSGMAPQYLAGLSKGRRKTAAFVCKLYARVVCVSPAIREAIHDLGVLRNLIEIKPAPLTNRRPEVVLQPSLSRWIEMHRPLISTVLFFRPEYGFGTLVSALARFRSRYPNFGCLVMGAGEEKTQAAQRLRAEGLEGNVLLTGDVEHEVCLKCISRSDVFVRATFADGDSISVREALSLGTPCVASDVCIRPAGVVPFRAGDVDDLLFKIEQAVAYAQTAS